MNIEDVDVKQAARHQQLLALWSGLSVVELLADLNILQQLLSFQEYQQQRSAKVVIAARRAVAEGGTHDCGEWNEEGCCALCGRLLT